MIMNQKLTDLSGLRQVVTEYSLGVWVNDDVLHLTLLSSRFNRWKWVDYLFVEGLENKQSSELQHKVRNFLKKNRVTRFQCSLALPRRDVVLRHLELPKETEENLDKVIEYQLLNLLPSEDETISYDYVSTKKDSKSDTIQVTIFIVLQSILDKYLNLCQQLGMRVDRVVPLSVAIANYYLESPMPNKNSIALAGFLETSSGELAGLSNQHLQSSRELTFFPENLTEAMKKEVELFQGQAHLPIGEPLNLFLLGEVPEKLKSNDNLIIHRLPYPVGFQVRSVLKSDNKNSGGALPSMLSATSGLKKNMPIGLNLLPSNQRVQPSGWEWIPTYILLGVNLLLLTALVFRGSIQQQNYLAEVASEVARLEPKVKQAREIESKLSVWRDKRNFLLSHKWNTRQILLALNELSTILPKDSMVTNLVLKDGVLEIRGWSLTAAAIPKILEDSKYFEQAEVISAITRQPSGRERYGIRVKLTNQKQLTGPGKKSKATSLKG